ncbi:MAG: 3-deoxy-D-manno-octulosonic acid transferase [Nitrospirae bacterium]|nr:3-deoxy-D-manno-octulosonic acid transferase [Nitrospirota bacterium]
MFPIYSFIYLTVLCILFIPQYLKRPKALRQKWLREKLGYVPFTNDAIWVHAVSVGEVNASVRLLKSLRSAYPDLPLMLSTITDTGQQVALEKAPEGTHLVYLPFDLKCILERAFRRVKPRIFITVETEFWPNIFRVMAEHRVPIIVLNGRISEKSARGYKKISFFMKKVLRSVKAFCMQSQLDADRLKKIGAEEKSIAVLGNFKFDMDMPEEAPHWTRAITGKVIVAGSTHSGEEEIILEAYLDNLSYFPELTLILAPRHPERFGEVEEMLKMREISFTARSALSREASKLNGTVILLDSIGELSGVYSKADIVITGKSLAGHGGQNPLEAAYWGKAVICGPHMENFPFIKEFYRQGAAFEVDAHTLSGKIRELLCDPESAEASGEKAKALYLKNSGAVARAMQIIRRYIS